MKKKIIIESLNETFKHKMQRIDTRTGVFSTSEFKAFDKLLNNWKKLNNDSFIMIACDKKKTFDN